MSFMCGQSTLMSREIGLVPLPDPVWQVEVDRVTPAEWSSMLDLFDDANLYQTWSYGAVRWGRKNLSHVVLKRNDEVVGIAQLRIVRPDEPEIWHGLLAMGADLPSPGNRTRLRGFLRVWLMLCTEEYVVKRRTLAAHPAQCFCRLAAG